MKEVRRKSADPAVNQLLVKAYRQSDVLIWDRMDAMQPQCGFGRLGIGCTDCFEGPCRVNPFQAVDQETACGKDKRDLAAGNLLRRVQDGASALLGLALSRGVTGDRIAAAGCITGDTMVHVSDLPARLAEAGSSLDALLSAMNRSGEGSAPDEVAVNMGALKADAVNVVLLGHVHPDAAAKLARRAALGGTGVNLLSICGHHERSALLTNYDSQEMPLLTGAVDLLVAGRQCVMPATLGLAARLGIPVLKAETGLDDDAADAALAQAAEHLRKRGAKADVPAVSEQALVGYSARTAGLADALRAAYGQKAVKGLVFLGGCGNVKHTQDADLISLAQSLIEAGYVLATAGCTGTALAKAGMCRPGYAAPFSSALPKDVPPVLHLGPCHAAQAVQELAASLAGMPCFVALPELTHNKTLAVGVALAASGLPVFLSAAAVPGLGAEDLGPRLIPLEDFTQLAHRLETAARP